MNFNINLLEASPRSALREEPGRRSSRQLLPSNIKLPVLRKNKMSVNPILPYGKKPKVRIKV